MADEESDITFFMGEDGNIMVAHPTARPDLTTEQAQVIATLQMAKALNEVASSLTYIGEQIYNAALMDD